MLSIEDQLSQALRDVLQQTGLPAPRQRSLAGQAGEGSLWEIPKDPSFGDLSNSLAFKLAAQRQQPPQRFAEEISDLFLARCRQAGLEGWIERVEAKAGFLNVFLSQRALTEILRTILRAGARYGVHRRLAASSINIEFVSANPTGPLSVAHGRQAAVGDSLGRLLRSQGYQVTTEYYLNDEGRQIELLGRSLRARYLQQLGQEEPFPEDGYHGAYVTDLAAQVKQRHGDGWRQTPEAAFAGLGMERLLEEIRRDLERFGLRFDRWSSQKRLRTTGRIDAVLQLLNTKGALYDSEDATWFASTKFGDDKDRVVRKRDGELTYLAPDIAYHQWKFQRGYDRVVNLWGPDHHGYIARLKAAVAALGLPAERLIVRIVQLVTLSRHGKAVAMSKRQGEFVTLREVLDEVGVDATRFFFLMRTMESHLDFDLELAKSQSQENPVYYVQYAHARICSILAKARMPWCLPANPLHALAQAGARWRPDLSRLQEPEERLLMRWLFQYPSVLRLCAAALEPHGLTIYLRKLAESFHVFYTKHRVISEDRRLSAARVALVRATRHVLANGLGILGVSTPTRM